MTQQDGLYRVCWRNTCAGYVVKGGKVTQCAPVLRKRMDWWSKIAWRIEDKPLHNLLQSGQP